LLGRRTTNFLILSINKNKRHPYYHDYCLVSDPPEELTKGCYRNGNWLVIQRKAMMAENKQTDFVGGTIYNQKK